MALLWNTFFVNFKETYMCLFTLKLVQAVYLLLAHSTCSSFVLNVVSFNLSYSISMNIRLLRQFFTDQVALPMQHFNSHLHQCKWNWKMPSLGSQEN